ncbi:CusA/CzcA family heavy metal efflux RND transporter [Paracrocinitomix mangrovi]|uniref:CusA/CzcA family heavy metal efflux RND transporter n=1 Tax=Paracrocinitomix mangrovi TaxID=2862509 RepID=UPI001C8E493C|nr:CusA/CzcA family heavy metal efflux RND transporter [Paracrocinitomix mangrovi]UKN01967.1 CusA/CzcA family heavy metal efflux RND transporter [Paracrocinitomix mangrovi]
MIDKIIGFSVKHKLFIGMLTVALIAGGIYSLKKVPLDAVPDITNNQVQVITQAPNLGTVEIEQFVTYPVELAMSNLPGVIEIRSVSRFGLSVVTIVFEDDMGTYLPRQLVAEKLVSVQQEIPEGFGTPEMGPISTGLGEIYQYSLQVDEEHEGQYSPTELRTIQDWIIRRQMTMVPGVVEVNAFGGDIKQYEVAVDPEKLNAMNITITEVFQALQANNQNTGGAYIEKDHYANFIRGEGLVKNLDDINNIVIKNVNGLPITIKDVATVQFGTAVRYGALTMDGKGEAVGGMILMLKGANSNDVIQAVQQRVTEIQSSLPEGVSVVPFLDRSKLISQTTGTVTQNLMEGALIVIFVLVFLLGNWRGGLIVASTIPLSLLFAFILMHVFGVWANLMSLGAIDFGIIIDGAVIIVEGTVFIIHGYLVKNDKLDQDKRDELAVKASSGMMNAAFFGQLIILIVFIPILALQGVEGKMFQPMALTFMFAMIGVMILCLTYVPMMSALFLRVKKSTRISWGDRLVHWLENIYENALKRVLRKSVVIMSITIAFLGGAVFLFTRMGGEFIPQLDEGDIAFHVILKPGSALSETVETTTRVEKVMMEKFPEVEHIISRIGVAEVPTDPMPMDVADVIVILKPQSEWTSASSKDELIDKMKKAVSEVPGVNYEFTQPIEMRFNELMTGVREDIAIKLYGDDLDILADKAEEITKIIAPIEGIGDMKAEAIQGLPQITVRYNRYKVAQYGLQINDLNELVASAFGGGHAGVIFEGERRFDLVVRLDQEHRQSIDNLKNLYVKTANGSQVPMKEIAEIGYEPGPMQISRDNTNRRVYVGINVRGRDIASLVDEIKEKLDAELQLPSGYYIRYGGTFENLERATNRLKVVVPVSLALIFLLIFSALKSIKQSVMIYMAIPFAAIGGILFLWIRDMPFSISAGVGFIVLFGVAVLNGLVLISGWNELKEEGKLSLEERIAQGAKRRIRPILLTALTDILGFLPMAISTSAGAEVQQPLATVVIGGMMTATFLTLFILPILYNWTERREEKKISMKSSKIVTILLLLGMSTVPFQTLAQTNKLETEEEVLQSALANSKQLQKFVLEVDQQNAYRKGSFNPDKTAVGVQYGQMNSFEKDLYFDVKQSFQFPTVYTSQWNLNKEEVKGSELHLSIAQNRLKWEVKKAWNSLQYDYAQQHFLSYKDSIFKEFYRVSKIKYEVEESSYLEMITAESEMMSVQNQLNIITSQLQMSIKQLHILISDTTNVEFANVEFEKRSINNLTDTSQIKNNPLLAYTQQQIEIMQAQVKVERSKMLPDIMVGYFNQSMIGSPTSSGSTAAFSDRFQGVQAGVTIPIFFGHYRSRIKATQIAREIEENQLEQYQLELMGQFQRQISQLAIYSQNLEFYENSGLTHAQLMIDQAQKSFEAGAITYVEYLNAIQHGLSIELSYLDALKNYNQAVIDLEYLLGY